MVNTVRLLARIFAFLSFAACSSSRVTVPPGAGGATDGGAPQDANAPEDAATSDDAALADVASIPPPIDDADAPPQPDAGPGGPWVAFVSYGPGKFDIYLVHDDGTGLRPLVVGQGENLLPSWSPDGARLAFASTRGSDAGGFSLFVVDVASGAISPIPTGVEGAVAPVWSPDGATIAFTGPGGLYVVPAAGGAAVPLTTGGYRDNSPAWSPDGKLVYFSSNREDGGGFDVWSATTDGGALVQVTSGTNLLGGPAVSPDGGTIAYAQVGGAMGTQVVFFGVGTSTMSVFSSMGDSEPAFGPSGTLLAATTTRYSGSGTSVVLLGVPGATSPFRLPSADASAGEATFQPAR